MQARDDFDPHDQASRHGGEGKTVRLRPHASAADLEAICERALSLYRVRALDSVDLSQLDSIAARAFVVARALMERGDARAYALGRQMLSFVED